MKVYFTTPTVTLPPLFLKLALTGWLQEHPNVTSAAMVRKGCNNDSKLYRHLGELNIPRINWSVYFRENPHLTEYTWDLIALRWEQPDWVVIFQGDQEDERLTYTKEIAERFDFNVAVLSPHDSMDAHDVRAAMAAWNSYKDDDDEDVLQEV